MISLWQALPLAALMRPDLERIDDAALRVRAEALRQRLFIDEQTIALERGEDLELVVQYASVVTLLDERDPGEALDAAKRTAAFLLFETGVEVDRRPELAQGVAALGDSDEAAARALAKSVKAFRAYGREAFAAALEAEPSLTGEAQAARLALDDGRALEAAERFVAATAKAPWPRFGVAACEALLAVGSDEAKALCDRLEARFSSAFPASAARFAEVERRAADARASDDASRREASLAADELVAEAWRRVRLGRGGAAERLARSGLERFARVIGGDEAAIARRGAAEVALALGRWEWLDEVLRGAADDDRLAEVRVVAGARAAIDRIRGKKPRAKEAAFADGLGAALAAFRGRADPETVRQLEVIVALDHAAGSDDARRSVLRAGQTLASAATRAESVALALIAPLALGRWDDDAAGIVAAVRGAAGAQAKALAARVDVGLGLANRDPARVDRALAALTGDDPALVLTRIVARRGREALNGAALPTRELAADRKALGELAFAFDEATPAGRLLSQARALTAATLELRGASSDAAIELLRESRRYGGELAPLAAGAAQLLLGDAPGAAELCERGEARDPTLRQALIVCRALGAATPKSLWAAAETLWDAAMLPQILAPGTVRPLFMPAFELDAELLPGAPPAIIARLSPVSTLAPELSPSRTEVRVRSR